MQGYASPEAVIGKEYLIALSRLDIERHPIGAERELCAQIDFTGSHGYGELRGVFKHKLLDKLIVDKQFHCPVDSRPIAWILKIDIGHGGIGGHLPG